MSGATATEFAWSGSASAPYRQLRRCGWVQACVLSRAVARGGQGKAAGYRGSGALVGSMSEVQLLSSKVAGAPP